MSKLIPISLIIVFAIILGASASIQDYSDSVSISDFMDGIQEAIYPAPGQMIGPGQLPAKVANYTYLGNQTTVSGPIYRDLGFTGVVNGLIVWTFGDTLWKPDPNQEKYFFLSSDSAAFGHKDIPTAVYDFGVTPISKTYPTEWIPLLPSEEASGGLSVFAMGGTNVIEYATNQGLVWFLKNNRSIGYDQIVGGGVATVTADLIHGPVANRTMDHMWESAWGEPQWGDVGVTYNPQDEYVYVYGNGKNSAVYLCRVKVTEALDVNAYTYWDNKTQTWNETRFGDGTNGTVNYSVEQAVWGTYAHGQSNPFWSNYYNTWMTVYGNSFPTSDIMYSTAPNLWGPWTPGISICPSCLPDTKCGDAFRYAMNPHPEYDITGKTLLVSWTDSNIQRLVKIVWE